MENSIKKQQQSTIKSRLSIPKSDLKDDLVNNFLSPLSSQSSIKSSQSSIKSAISNASKNQLLIIKRKKLYVLLKMIFIKVNSSTTILLKGKRCPWGYRYKKIIKIM